MNSKPKLLYAEDNRLTAKEMTEILEEEGYEVVTTYSGDEAWETFQRISPDLVLLDFRMPGLNGLEVFEHIRQANAEIPVLILSSYNEYCVPSLKSGTADFIRKEADIEEICARIAAVWQRHASGKTNDSAGETVLRLSELTTFRTDSFTLRIGPNIIPLTGALGEVLVLLCRPPRQCRAATDICRQLWHNDSKSKITLLQNYISQLRKLLTADPALHIVSLYNKGYYLQINGEYSALFLIEYTDYHWKVPVKPLRYISDCLQISS